MLLLVCRLIDSAIKLQEKDNLPSLPREEYIKAEEKLRNSRNYYVRVTKFVSSRHPAVVYNCFFVEAGQATMHQRDIILHAV